MILLIAALATYRLTRLVIEDTITESVRLWIWQRYGLDSFVGGLIDCAWCASIWVGTAVSLLLWTTGAATLSLAGWLLLPLAFSAITGILSRSD